MRRLGLLFLIVAACSGPAPAQEPPAANAERAVVAAAPGRIEGSAPAINIGAAVTGIVDEVPVSQGDRVTAGQLLVRISCDDIAARIEQRRAELAAAAARLEALFNGPRVWEIEAASAAVAVAAARLAEARARLGRLQRLVERDNASRAAFEAAERDTGVAEAEILQARARLDLLEAGTREEELAEADARAVAAEHAVASAEAEFAKCEITSPIDGVVLHKHVSKGELVTFTYPAPLLTLAENRRLRVRAEVDERDVGLIGAGQEVEVVIDGGGARRLDGTVASLAPVMGRRQILTSDPADKSDRDVLEVLIDLDEELRDLPIGLRVSVLFYKS